MNSFTKEERKDFAQKNVRKEVVTSFINKLEKADIADIGLIPALIDYIDTGDSSMFEEYNKFREMSDAEEKAKEMERRKTFAQERYEEEKSYYEQKNGSA